MATNASVQRVISLNKVFAKILMNVSKIKQVPVGHMETALILKVASIALATLVLLLQVILFEIDCTIFYTNFHELFCQFIS